MKGAMRKRTGSKKKKLENRVRNPSVLPQLVDQLETAKTLRFITTGIGGSASVTITYANILDSWLIAGTATASYQLFDFVKVRRVSIRAIPFSVSGANAAFQASVTVGIEFAGLTAGFNGSGGQASQTALGLDECALVTLAPGRNALCGMWQASSNAVAFVLRATNADSTVSLGAVIDLELSFKNSADVSPAAISSAIAGATPGNLYYGGIDGGRLAATWARSAFIPRI